MVFETLQESWARTAARERGRESKNNNKMTLVLRAHSQLSIASEQIKFKKDLAHKNHTTTSTARDLVNVEFFIIILLYIFF